MSALSVLVLVGAAASPVGATVRIDVNQAGADVQVVASGSLDLTGATYDHAQPYTTGIIPGGSTWYVALGTTPGMDWYQLTSTQLPFGTSGTYFTSGVTSGDAISIWGYAGGNPLVGVATGYVSGTPISATMTLAGETISGMSLKPGVYTFGLPNDTVVLDIVGVPEPATWAVMLVGFAGLGAAVRRSRRETAAA